MKAVKTVYLIALLVGILMALQVGKKWITTTPYFEIVLLEIWGNDHLTPEEIKATADIGGRQNIFTLDRDEVRSRILSHPWVKKATVRRKLPRTLKISLEERKPLAVLEGDPEALLDEEGIILSVAPEASLLPHISGGGKEEMNPGQSITGERTLMALKIVETVSSLPFVPNGELRMVDVGKSGNETIYLRENSFPIVLGTDFIDVRLRRLFTIREHLKKKNSSIKYVDLTFKDKVIVNYQREGG